MFWLDNSHLYWLYNRPGNLSLVINDVGSIVTNQMRMHLRDGEVFVFVNTARNRMKILNREEGGLVPYVLRMKNSRMPGPSR